MTPTEPMPDSPEFTIRQIAEAKDVSFQAVKKRSLHHRWSYREEPCLGGKRRLYTLSSLPVDVQAALLSTNPVRLTETNTTDPDTNTAGYPAKPAPI